MKRILIPVLFIASLWIAACKPAAVPAPTATPEQVVTLSPESLYTPTPQPACTTIDTPPTPGPDEPSLFPNISADDYVRGASDATVTFIEYGDFQDIRSSAAALSFAQLVENYPEDVRVVYRPYPLVQNFDKSALATQAAEAAALQGKFWEMHDLLFNKQTEWGVLSTQEFIDWIQKQAESLGLDKEQFAKDLQSEAIVNKVQQAIQEGQTIGLPGVPILLVNGQYYSGPRDYADLERIVNLIALGKRQFKCPPFTIDPSKQYTATLHTEKGDIVIALYADKAPMAVNSFVFLANNGWYDNITFHRVILEFVAQTGDPSGTGAGNPGYFFDNEIDDSLSFNQAGIVGMANSGPDTNGSQFFITLAPAPHLDGQYTIFGRVIKGLDVAQQLTERNPAPGLILPPGDKLVSVTIEEK